MEKEEAIDLGKLLRIMIEKKKNVGVIVLGCTLVALIMAFVLPKTYESTALVQTRNAKEFSGASAALAAISGGSSTSATMGYIELMKSRSVLDPIIANLDIPDDKKETMEARSFAKTNLDIQEIYEIST